MEPGKRMKRPHRGAWRVGTACLDLMAFHVFDENVHRYVAVYPDREGRAYKSEIDPAKAHGFLGPGRSSAENRASENLYAAKNEDHDKHQSTKKNLRGFNKTVNL